MLRYVFQKLFHTQHYICRKWVFLVFFLIVHKYILIQIYSHQILFIVILMCIENLIIIVCLSWNKDIEEHCFSVWYFICHYSKFWKVLQKFKYEDAFKICRNICILTCIYWNLLTKPYFPRISSFPLFTYTGIPVTKSVKINHSFVVSPINLLYLKLSFWRQVQLFFFLTSQSIAI